MATTIEQPNIEDKPLNRIDLKKLDWPTLLPFLGTLVLLTVLVWPMFGAWQFEYNKPGSYYAHAPLIPFIIALMFWARRETLFSVPKAPAPIAAVVLIPALAIFVFSSKSFALSLMSMAFLLIVWSGLWLTLGAQFVRAFWVPLLFISMMIPLPAPVLNDATLKLQMFSTVMADKLLHLMTFHTVLHGNVIQMDNFPLFVDVPCSGFKTLVSLLTFSAAFAYLVDGTRGKRLILFLLSIPLALAINSVRIALIGVVGECINDHAAHVFHDYSGIFTLILGFTVLFSIAKAFGCRTFAGWPIF
jgi:exosortase